MILLLIWSNTCAGYTRLKYYGDGDVILHHKYGIYSIVNPLEKQKSYSSDIRCTGEDFYLQPLQDVEYLRIFPI